MGSTLEKGYYGGLRLLVNASEKGDIDGLIFLHEYRR